MKFFIKNMKFSIKNMKLTVYEVCQNSSFVLFVTEFSYHMYRKNAVLNGKQKQMKPLHTIGMIPLETLCFRFKSFHL